MRDWKRFIRDYFAGEMKAEKLRSEAEKSFEEYGVYPRSIQEAGNAIVMMAWEPSGKSLVAVGDDPCLDGLEGSELTINNKKVKVCPLTNENCQIIRRIFPYTNPQPHQGHKVSMGLGDRLGLASPGHIEAVRDLDVFPVLAQQSIRELNLTGRTYDDVISAAAWAVFQEGYTKGYGADGDHLKTHDEVKMALDIGMTMITLDCSEHIDNGAAGEDISILREKYAQFSQQEREAWEKSYADKSINLEGCSFFITRDDMVRMACVYGKAIRHTLDIYHNLIAKCGRPIDFEKSIDETLTSTTPASHYFVASELIRAGVSITSLAPRFCGEFQKGIDYVGDLQQFTREFSDHVAIANHFGYKISVHSGSDKFKVFPIVGEKTGGNYHLKTAGTNWLEAVRVIAMEKPELYRRMHTFALEHLHEAKKYYHISAKPENIPSLEQLKHAELVRLMDEDDSRQVMHITYGLQLQAKDGGGGSLFREEFYSALHIYENEYMDRLKKHIGRHLEGLGLL